MKKYLALILALVMALSLVACGDNGGDANTDDGNGNANTEAAGRVYWLNFKPESDEVLQQVAGMYTEKTGVPVTVVTAASGTYNETLTAEMDKSEAPTDLATGGHDAGQEFRDGKAAFQVQGSWEYSSYKDSVPNAAMIPYCCGAEGEEKAGLNCGTENCRAVNAKASEEDIQTTLDFMYWMVTDAEVSCMLVDSFGVMPYKNAAEFTNAFLADANEYSNSGCYVMNWATNFQPNVDAYLAALVSALNQYNADQTADNWALVETDFVDG